MFKNLLKRKLLAKYVLLSVSLLSLNGCSKSQDPIVEQPIDEFSYEVKCTSCDITYTDESNSTKYPVCSYISGSSFFSSKTGLISKS